MRKRSSISTPPELPGPAVARIESPGSAVARILAAREVVRAETPRDNDEAASRPTPQLQPLVGRAATSLADGPNSLLPGALLLDTAVPARAAAAKVADKSPRVKEARRDRELLKEKEAAALRKKEFFAMQAAAPSLQPLAPSP